MATTTDTTPTGNPAPPTVDVPWWEALRDERLLPGDLGTRCISTGFVGGRRWVGEGDAIGSYLNPDGTVTVQAQGVSGDTAAKVRALQALADEIERHTAMVPPEDMRGAWEDGRQSAYRNVLAWIADGIPGHNAECRTAEVASDA